MGTAAHNPYWHLTKSTGETYPPLCTRCNRGHWATTADCTTQLIDVSGRVILTWVDKIARAKEARIAGHMDILI